MIVKSALFNSAALLIIEIASLGISGITSTHLPLYSKLKNLEVNYIIDYVNTIIKE